MPPILVHTKSFYSFTAVLLCACFFARTARADDSYATRTNTQPLKISLVKEEIPGISISRAYLTVGTNKFAFIVPDDFRVNATSEDKTLLINTEYNCFISISVADPKRLYATELDPQTYRELLLNRYTDAKITGEFVLPAASHVGPAFDLEWKISGGGTQSARVLFIPSASGILEFNLTAASGKFEAGKNAFGALLRTFVAGKDGKLEVIPVSNKL